jgi:hypothetical protein
MSEPEVRRIIITWSPQAQTYAIVVYFSDGELAVEVSASIGLALQETERMIDRKEAGIYIGPIHEWRDPPEGQS